MGCIDDTIRNTKRISRSIPIHAQHVRTGNNTSIPC